MTWNLWNIQWVLLYYLAHHRTELCTPALEGIFVKTVIETLIKKLFSELKKNIYVKNMNSQTPQLKNLDHNRHSRTFVKMNNKKSKKDEPIVTNFVLIRFLILHLKTI